MQGGLRGELGSWGQLDKWVLESLLSEESWGLAPPTEDSLGLRQRVHVMETVSRQE